MDSKRNQAVKTAWVGFPPRSEETRLLTFPCFSGELGLDGLNADNQEDTP